MTSWETRYWRVFNVSVRVLGLVALWAGAVFIVWGAARMLQMEFIRMEETPRLAILAVGLLVAALGWAILRVPTYRPDLGDASCKFEPFGTKAPRSSAARRSWWTGERLTASR